MSANANRPQTAVSAALVRGASRTRASDLSSTTEFKHRSLRVPVLPLDPGGRTVSIRAISSSALHHHCLRCGVSFMCSLPLAFIFPLRSSMRRRISLVFLPSVPHRFRYRCTAESRRQRRRFFCPRQCAPPTAEEALHGGGLARNGLRGLRWNAEGE